MPLASLLDRLEGLGDAYCSLLIRCLGVHIQGGPLGGGTNTQVSLVITYVYPCSLIPFIQGQSSVANVYGAWCFHSPSLISFLI